MKESSQPRERERRNISLLSQKHSSYYVKDYGGKKLWQWLSTMPNDRINYQGIDIELLMEQQEENDKLRRNTGNRILSALL